MQVIHLGQKELAQRWRMANPKRVDWFERNANGRPLSASFRFNRVNKWVFRKNVSSPIQA
jgi:hypothetical protein